MTVALVHNGGGGGDKAFPVYDIGTSWIFGYGHFLF